MGTKTVYTKKLLKKIEKLASIGYPQVLIERALGLPKESLSKNKYISKRRGKVEIVECFTRAREKYIQYHLRTAQKVGEKDWRFHDHRAALAEPEHFSEKHKIGLSVDEGISIVIEKADRKGKKNGKK